MSAARLVMEKRLKKKSARLAEERAKKAGSPTVDKEVKTFYKFLIILLRFLEIYNCLL